MKNILLVEPEFPYPSKSKNKANLVHKNFLPIGLLKLAAYYNTKGYRVQLVRGNKRFEELSFIPDDILVTSLFTYWSDYVWSTIGHYRKMFPHARIKLGGIYATLHSGRPSFENKVKEFNVQVKVGLVSQAENYYPDYSLFPDVEYHATHMMRGCIRKCSFCGTWKIEPIRTNKSKDRIIRELKSIGKNKVIFYDNNILVNPSIKDILKEFSNLKINGRPVLFESQSGFDGRLLENDFELAHLIKKARFKNVRIAWDNKLSDSPAIERQLKHLMTAGYSSKEMSVFMIYNFDIPFEEMLLKIEHCKKWGVQISDCRYRPLSVEYDNYNPRRSQAENDYYIHLKAGWTDEKIKKFRREVRTHNIWIRYAKDKGMQYDKRMEKWSAINSLFKYFGLEKTPKMELIEGNPYFEKRIRLLNKIKTFCIVNNVNPKELDLKKTLFNVELNINKVNIDLRCADEIDIAKIITLNRQ